MSGALVDVALVAIALELVGLTLWWRRTRRGLHPLDLFGHLLAGALLLLAVRVAVTGGDTAVVFLLLGASFPAHLYDLVRRARAVPPPGPTSP